MSGVAMRQTLTGMPAVGAAFKRLHDLGENPRAVWESIGQAGETSTRLRFKNQAGPDGVKWKPSRRAKKTGGQTLVLKARLLRSITHKSDAKGAEWGTNVVYGRIHQLGGTIERKARSGKLRLRTTSSGALLRRGNGRSVFATRRHKQAVSRDFTVGEHSIGMPARPYLGVNEADGAEFLQLAENAVNAAAANRGVA